ncbi:MAG: ABC transporter permease subunit, partial [Hyphomicrobiales bacterium]
PVTSLFSAYGRWLGAGFVLLTGLWIAMFIVTPQLSMIERAFIYVDRGDALVQLGNDIDLTYARLGTIDYDIKALERPGSTAGGTPASSFSPGALPGGAATPQDKARRLQSLKQESAELMAKAAALEKRESEMKASKSAGPNYSLKNFTSMSWLQLNIFLRTVLYALGVTILAFIFCYPVAYAVAQAKTTERAAMLMLGLLIPYTINELLRIFAWILILSKEGVLNGILDSLGILDSSAGEGLRFLASNGAVFTVMIYAYILFMVFPIYNTIETLDRNQIDAARDLGASTWRIHWRVVLPHAKPGIAVGAIMTFMLSIGSIAVPGIVGRGLHPDWFSQIIYRRFFESGDWNVGAAFSITLLLVCILFILITMRAFGVGIKEIAR